MQPVVSTRAAEVTGQNQSVSQTTETKKTSGDASEFEAILRSAVRADQANQVNEEELFAGMVFERLKTTKGDEVAAQYSSALETQKGVLKKGDGYIPYEDAAKNALKSLRESGALTKEEADKTYSEAFDASQLDTNTDALFDGRGGAGDPTIALALLDSALASSRLMIEKFTAGELSASSRSLDDTSSAGNLKSITPIGTAGDASSVPLQNTPQGTTFDGPKGFLFKPESSTDGNLAILLPQGLAQQVLSLVLNDETGKTLEEGRSTGYGEEGINEKFAFTKPGGSYGDNLTVKALLADGTVREWTIPDGSKRYD